MDRGQAIGGKSTAKNALGNDVIKDVDAIKDNKVYELDPKLWYFASGSTTTAIKQIEEVEKALENKVKDVICGETSESRVWSILGSLFMCEASLIAD